MSARRIAAGTERWFREHQRPLPWRRAYDPYQVWVSEVMLQQTRMEVVLAYYERFLDRFPTVASLAASSNDEVTATWSGLGYYRRARMLREGAIAVFERFGGQLPADVESLMTIPGVGRYTAGAISSIAYDRHAPIVDGNVARVTARLFAIEAPLASTAFAREAWCHSEELVAAAGSPRDFNQGLMELGALICTPRNPHCTECPLRSYCAAYQGGRVDELPWPKARAVRRALRVPLYLARDEAGRILMRREIGALMRDMFHLPHGNNALFDETPLHVSSATAIGSFQHTITNRRITFEVFRVTPAEDEHGETLDAPTTTIRDGPAHRYTWVHPSELAAVPHPSYVQKALRVAGIRPPTSMFETA